MVTFNIVEQNSTEVFNKLYLQIKQDVLNGISVKDIQKKHGLTKTKWMKYRKELQKEGLVKTREQINENATHIRKGYKGSFNIRRSVNGKYTHFCVTKTYEEAELVVSKLDEYGWSKENISLIKQELGL